MARPNKQGVDYFPLDVHLDDKFKFVEIKYKLEGFAVLIKLMQKIYSYGYWYKWTDDEALLFSDELRTSYELVNNVVNECLERGVFNKELFEKYQILTSTGIQKRYKEIVRRRKDVELTEEYLLIDGTFGVNDDINTSSSSQSDNKEPSKGKQSDGKSTQSKVKESKVKQNKDKIAFRELVHLTQKEHDRLVDQYGEKRVELMLDELDNWKGMKGVTYKDDNRAIRKWVADKVLKDNPLPKKEREVPEENKIRYRLSQLEGTMVLGREHFERKGKLDEYLAEAKEYEELEHKLRAYQN